MKKIVLFGMTIWALLALILSCDNDNTNQIVKPTINAQQTAFNDFLTEKNNQWSKQQNDIKKKEFMNQFEDDLYNFVDSVGLFVNWKGMINNISSSSTGSRSTSIDFCIWYLYQKVKFRCIYVVDNDSLKNDYIYNTVKNLSNSSVVYFDGFIRTTNKHSVSYHYNKPGDFTNVSYPEYDFFIIDVREVSKGDTLSSNLQSAINHANRINNVLKQNIHKEISDEEMQNQLEAINPEFNMSKSKLTTEEVAYLDRLTNAMTMNVIYSDY